MASDLHMSSTDYSTAVSPAFPPLARKRASVSGSPRDFFFADAPLLASVYSCRFSSSDTCSTRFPPTWFSRAPSLRSSCLRSCSSGVSRSSLHLWSSRDRELTFSSFLSLSFLFARFPHHRRRRNQVHRWPHRASFLLGIHRGWICASFLLPLGVFAFWCWC